MRKLFYLMVLFSASVLTACSNEVDPVVEDNQSDSLVYMHINCRSDYKVAAMTRGLTGDLASLCTSLDVYIQHNTNNTITEVHQVNTDDNFGDITVGLARATSIAVHGLEKVSGDSEANYMKDYLSHIFPLCDMVTQRSMNETEAKETDVNIN